MRLCELGTAFAVIVRIGTVAFFGVALASCAQAPSKYGVKASPRVVNAGDPVPKGGGTYRVGNPYVIAGRTYVPQENTNYRAEGKASWYGADFHGRLTANGEAYDMHGLSAAHPTLPLPSYVRVTNLENKRSVVVRVNDRGPYHDNRVIDLSMRAAKILGFYDKGIAQVRVEFVARASLSGSDDNKLAETLRTNEPASPLVRVASSEPRNQPALRPSLLAVQQPIQTTPPVHSAALTGRGLY